MMMCYIYNIYINILCSIRRVRSATVNLLVGELLEERHGLGDDLLVTHQPPPSRLHATTRRQIKRAHPQLKCGHVPSAAAAAAEASAEAAAEGAPREPPRRVGRGLGERPIEPLERVLALVAVETDELRTVHHEPPVSLEEEPYEQSGTD